MKSRGENNMNDQQSTTNYKFQVFVASCTLSFLLTFAVSMISTPTPYLIKEFITQGDVENVTMMMYGMILSLGYVALTLGSLIGGFIADITSKKKVIFTSFIILAIGCGLFVAATNLYFLFLASFIEMLAMGVSRPAIIALIADYSEQNSRGMAYGFLNLSWIMAQIPAPLLGGIMTQYLNLKSPFIFAVCISVSGIFVSAMMKEKIVQKKHSAIEEKTVTNEPNLRNIISLKKVVFIFGLTNLLDGLFNGFFAPLMRGLLVFRLNANPAEFGLISSIAFGIVTALVQIPGGKLADKFGRKPLVLFGFLGAPFCFLLAFSHSLFEFTLLAGIGCAVANISYPAALAWLMDFVPKHRRASVSGITRALNGIGLSIGPTAGSFVWNYAKPDATMPFGVAASVFATSLPFYLMLVDSRKLFSKNQNDSNFHVKTNK